MQIGKGGTWRCKSEEGHRGMARGRGDMGWKGGRGHMGVERGEVGMDIYLVLKTG